MNHFQKKAQKLLSRRQMLLLGLGGLTGLGISASNLLNLKIDPEISKKSKVTEKWLEAQNRKFTITGNTSLAQRAATKGLIYGTAVRQSALSSDQQFATSVAKECAMIVPEWELKWNFLRPTPDSFDFAPADWLLDFAINHRMLFRGHTLVWHKQSALPKWFESYINSKNAKQIFEDHITTVVKHYQGKIHSWDVVNEAIHIPDGRSDGLRNTPWLKWLGTDYIDLAFRIAAQADPQALLMYNDDGLDYDTDEAEAKRNAVIKLLKRLKSQGTPIHALGIQAHLSSGETRLNRVKLRDFINQVADLGLKIMITELDVRETRIPLKLRDRVIAANYEDYLSIVLDNKAVIGVINWGLSDKYTWLSQSRPDRAPVRPLPLDDKMQRKLAWNAIARAFDNAPPR